LRSQRRNIDLDDGAPKDQIRLAHVGQRRPEARERPQHASGVLRRYMGPEVEITGRARKAVDRDRIRSNEEAVSALVG
jgi:hypothetical protein